MSICEQVERQWHRRQGDRRLDTPAATATDEERARAHCAASAELAIRSEMERRLAVYGRRKTDLLLRARPRTS